MSEQAEPSAFKDKALHTLHAIVNEPLTPLCKVLLVATFIFLLLTSVFIGLFVGSQQKLNLERQRPWPPLPAPSQPPPEICMTPECIIASAEILSSLDTTQDPCENFYEFANGGWLQKNPIPTAKSNNGAFAALAEQNKKVLRKILEAENTFVDPNEYQLLGKLQGFYESCMNEKRIEEVGDAPLKAFVQKLRSIYAGNTTYASGGIEIGMKGTPSLATALAFLHSHGIDSLFSFIIKGDAGSDPNQLLLWFYQPSLGLPSKEYYHEESILEVYRTVIKDLHLALLPDEEADAPSVPSPAYSLTPQGNDDVDWPWPWPWPGDNDKPEPVNETERIIKLTREMVNFEAALANASLDLDVLQQDPFASYNPVDHSNLTISLPSINWENYFSSFTSRTLPPRLILTYPPYAESLAALLARTDSEVIEFYLITRSALALAPYLGTGSTTWRAKRVLVEELTGIKKGAVGDRDEFCIQQVEDNLGFAAGRYFVNETFGGDSKEKGTKVIQDITNAFVASLDHLEWMDRPSAQRATEKARALQVKIGYPSSPNTDSPTSLLNYYALDRVDPNNFFDNILASLKAAAYRSWSQLGRKRDHGAWKMYPSIVDAYYDARANEIAFPAGIFQPPFFSKTWPSYLVFGAFGQVAAHELTHAFDSAGRLYNQHGKLEEWWTNSTSEGFNKIQTCIVNQFANYTIDNGKGGKVHLNGNLTSGENIADSGLIQAYRAWKGQYRSTSSVTGNDFLLPGLDFTSEQLFFIAFGRIWADHMKPAAALQRVRADPHSPAKYRVEGTLVNIPEFAQAFGCKVGSKLNPPIEQQCRFWG